VPDDDEEQDEGHYVRLGTRVAKLVITTAALKNRYTNNGHLVNDRVRSP
jgi:hypothetical protein